MVFSSPVKDDGRPEDRRHAEMLERNWRRVASTHTLQDLLDADKPPDEAAFSAPLLLLGLLLVAAGAASAALGVFAIVVAPLLPRRAGGVVGAIQGDSYYHLLVPLTVPVTIAAVFLNWFSMKLFKHNT